MVVSVPLNTPISCMKAKVKPQGNGAEDKPYLSEPEVAEMFNVTRQTVQLWRLNGDLPAFRIGRTIRYYRDEILKHLQENCRA